MLMRCAVGPLLRIVERTGWARHGEAAVTQRKQAAVSPWSAADPHIRRTSNSDHPDHLSKARRRWPKGVHIEALSLPDSAEASPHPRWCSTRPARRHFLSFSDGEK